MAYDTLKAEIRQYIKTNGANEITGQILQNVLLDMVNAYPSLDGYATQQWVQNQNYVTESALSGYATQQWVQNQLGGYLPLSGGTLTGVVNFTNTYGSGSIFVDSIDYDLNITASNSIYLNAEHGVGVNGKITANTFEKSGGTSSQFLKADGSVDSNTYLTSAAISDMATQTWVGQNYLPLSGGTLTGVVNFTNTYGSGSIFVDSTDYDLNITASNSIYLNAEHGVGVNGKITANTFEKSGGTSAQFLKADGSVDSNTYLTSAAISDMATQTWVGQQGFLTSSAISDMATQTWVGQQGFLTSSSLSGYATETWVGNNYLALNGGTLTGVVNFTNTYGSGSIFVDSVDYDLNITASNSIYLNADHGVGVNGKITANTFEKSGGTSTQFLKADGSVDSNTYLTSSAISDMATQTWVGQQGFLTSSAISDMATQTWVGQQGFLTSSSLSGYATETWVGNNYLPLNGGTLKNTGNYSTDLYIIDGLDTYTNRIYADGDGLNIFSGNDLYLTASGDVQTGNNNNLYVYGTVYANSFQQTSDIRRKNIISDIGMAIGDIAKAPMFRFTMKDDDEAIVRVGTSAQYWQTVIPEVVSEDKRGVLGLQYDVAALAGVITVAKRVVDHEARIAELEKENALLKAKLNIN